MKIYMSKLMLLGLLGLVLALGLVVPFRSKPSSVQASAQVPTVTNKTIAVEVIAVKAIEPTGFELLMRNISGKNINGFSIGFDRGASVTSDLTSTARPIVAPGEEFKLRLPATKTIIIRDVIFDDDSIDGDAAAAAELQDRRAGIREELDRIMPLLSKAAGTASDIKQLKTQIAELPELADAGRSPYVAAGRRNAREDALLALEKLEENSDRNEVKAGLTKLVEETRERKARLTRQENQ